MFKDFWTNVIAFINGSVWEPIRKASQLREVKREIERRGWSWMSVGSKHRHEFAIWDYVRPTGGTPAGFAPELGRAVGETEEIAGCLAFKEASEMDAYERHLADFRKYWDAKVSREIAIFENRRQRWEESYQRKLAESRKNLAERLKEWCTIER